MFLGKQKTSKWANKSKLLVGLYTNVYVRKSAKFEKKSDWDRSTVL